MVTTKTKVKTQEYRGLSEEATLIRFKENALARAKDFDLKKILPMYIEYYTEILEKSKV